MNPKTRNILIAVLAALLLVLGKWRPWKPVNRGGGAAARGGAAVEVLALRIVTERLEPRVQTNGTVLANEAVDLTTESAGLVDRVLFREGQRVARGDLLVSLIDADLQARRVRLVQEAVLAGEQQARFRRQLEIESVSQEAYDAARTKAEAAKADVREIEALIGKKQVRAPFGGVVGLRAVSEGAYLPSGARIARLVDPDPVKVEFTVPERYAGLVRVGRPVTFTVQGSGRTFDARVYAKDPDLDAGSRGLRVRALHPNADGAIVPGAFADVTMALEPVDGTILVPSSAIAPELLEPRVYVARSGKAQPVRVRTGLRTGERVQITDGLSAGDTLITTGLLQLRPGAPVRITGWDQSP